MTEKIYPDDMHERWRAGIFNDGRGTLHLVVSARTPGQIAGSGKYLVVAPLQFRETGLGEGAIPMLTETFEEQRDNLGDVTGFLQAIVNAAWEQGIKPEAMKDHRGELGATKAHLEDMRTLVFAKAEIIKP